MVVAIDGNKRYSCFFLVAELYASATVRKVLGALCFQVVCACVH